MTWKDIYYDLVYTKCKFLNLGDTRYIQIYLFLKTDMSWIWHGYDILPKDIPDVVILSRPKFLQSIRRHSKILPIKFRNAEFVWWICLVLAQGKLSQGIHQQIMRTYVSCTPPMKMWKCYLWLQRFLWPLDTLHFNISTLDQHQGIFWRFCECLTCTMAFIQLSDPVIFSGIGNIELFLFEAKVALIAVAAVL